MTLRKQFGALLVSCAMLLSGFALPAAAEEETEAGDLNPEETEWAEETEASEETEVIEEENETSSPDDGVLITAFEEFEDHWIETEVKPQLEEVTAQMPAVLNVKLGPDVPETEWVSVPAEWHCLDDYEEDSMQYTFEPVMEGYAVSEEAVKPQMYLKVGTNPYDDLCGEIEEDIGITIPSVIRQEERMFAATKYDGRSYLPPVRNQGNEGACWSFAGIGAVEADLIRSNFAEKDTIDLSELQVAYFASHNYTDLKNNHTGDSIDYRGTGYLSNGGNATLVYRSFANNVGPVLESDVPYAQKDTLIPDMKYAMSANAFQVVGAYIMEASSRDDIKEAIMEHGGVSASIYASEGVITESDVRYEVRYNSKNNAFYGTYPHTNHAIMLVGWDDTFSAGKFASGCQPEGDGAWLVRNSWGLQGEGKSGYFWLSYYDKGLNSRKVYAYDAQAERYDYCYSYDMTPLPGYYWPVSNKTVTVSQSYQVDGGEIIKAVGFEVGTPNLDAAITVSDGTDTSSVSVHLSHAGFHLIPLTAPMQIDTERDVTFTVTYTAQHSSAIQIPFEKVITDYEYGKIYYTGAQSGPGFRINGTFREGDARMKLYTSVSDQIPITVYHNKETLSGSYELSETTTVYAAEGETVQPAVKSYEGFSSPAVQSVVAEEGKTVTYNYSRNSYTLTVNKGTGVQSVSGGGTIKYEASVALQAVMKDGYEFSGWSGDYNAGSFAMPAKNVTVKAEGTPVTYSITYDLDGGRVSGDNRTQYDVTTASFTLNNPIRNGYVFKGWSGTGLSGDENTSVTIERGSTGSRSYTAHWIGMEQVSVEHQLEALNGGFVTVRKDTISAVSGSQVTPDVRTYTGFTSPQKQTITAKSDCTVIYRYARNSYTLTVNRSTGVQSVSGGGAVKYQTPIMLEAVMEDGYEFSRWSGTYHSGTFLMPAENVTMTAYAKPIVYSIAYELNGGSVSAGNPAQYDVTTASFTLNNPTRSGYVFKGWSGTGLNGDENTAVTIERGSTGSRMYSANWQEQPTPSPSPAPSPTADPEAAISMYRMYNPNSGEHFYTGNEAEKNALKQSGWKEEGIGFYAPVNSDRPMYRLYNPNAGDHHYTASRQEKEHLLKMGWKDEGIGWYAAEKDGIPMYRLYNPNAVGAGSHHYTSSETERESLKQAGWKDEGIGFYTARR